jgi:hypothetical protein
MKFDYDNAFYFLSVVVVLLALQIANLYRIKNKERKNLQKAISKFQVNETCSDDAAKAHLSMLNHLDQYLAWYEGARPELATKAIRKEIELLKQIVRSDEDTHRAVNSLIQEWKFNESSTAPPEI